VELVSTATLEERVALALRASQRRELAACLWDLPAAGWWRRRRRERDRDRRNVMALIVADDRAAVRVALASPARSWVIGRDDSCDVHVENTSVSRRHAVVSRRGGLCRIRDLASSNGTVVNGSYVDVADLRPGDEVHVGEVRIRVR
jgi:hypothetical protein